MMTEYVECQTYETDDQTRGQPYTRIDPCDPYIENSDRTAKPHDSQVSFFRNSVH